ncbi:hypothetical protein V7S43_003894 [Phytophthora oleae]|uniref:Uncharacterized protein n=1 Tax=Phytophthora oleae TaxID=2107226 RepID=A0ABD3FYI2_9STRA
MVHERVYDAAIKGKRLHKDDKLIAKLRKGEISRDIRLVVLFGVHFPWEFSGSRKISRPRTSKTW